MAAPAPEARHRVLRRFGRRRRQHGCDHQQHVADAGVGLHPFPREQERQLPVDPRGGVHRSHSPYDGDQLVENLGLAHRRVFSAAHRAAEDERTNLLGMTERQLLRDHAAHRHAVDVGVVDAETVEEACGIVGHLHDGVRAARPIALPRSAVVVVDGAKAAEERDRPEPGLARHAVPHDEEERFTLPRLVVVDLHAIDRRIRHRDLLRGDAVPRRRLDDKRRGADFVWTPTAALR